MQNSEKNSFSIFKTGLGQDSHRFLSKNISKPFIIGGITFDNVNGLQADSDGDVIFHSICNAISSITGVLILGDIATELCNKNGITDSSFYVKKALETLSEFQKIVHVAISIEAKKPLIFDKIPELKKSIAKVMNIDAKNVGITATSGEGLTTFGCGEGIACMCIISIIENQ
jgi:2-C-methyl-D-erythritol 2,4-cyclodiphosphate synthase